MAQHHSLEWKYRGKRGFVIGGGASINDLDVDFKELVDNEIVVGVNKAYRLCVPDFLVSIDLHFLRDSAKELMELNCIKVIPDVDLCVKEFQEDETRLVIIQDNCKPTHRSHMRVLPPKRFDKFCYVGGSGLFGLKIAYILGLNPIYLLGFDCIQVEGKSHFHSEYKNVLSNNSLKIMSMPILQFCRNIKQTLGIEVISCSPESLLNRELPFQDISEVLENATSFK